MELTLKGYGISLRVRKVEDAPDHAARLAVLRSPSPERRAEVEEQHALAAYNRYLSPIR